MIDVINFQNSNHTPIWTISISNDPITDLPRKIESQGLLIMQDVIRLKTIMYFVDNNGDKLSGIRYRGTHVDLEAFNNEAGPFIDPTTGVRVLPDENGQLPDGTILRYTALLAMIGNPVVIATLVNQFIQAADINGEFNI